MQERRRAQAQPDRLQPILVQSGRDGSGNKKIEIGPETSTDTSSRLSKVKVLPCHIILLTVSFMSTVSMVVNAMDA
jgi:hypothetical protein